MGFTVTTGAEIHLNQDGTISERVITLSRSKDLVTINSKVIHTAASALNLSEIKGPVALVITGRGVLIKKKKGTADISEQVLQQLFPGIQLSQFYVQHFVSGIDAFIAIIRKDSADGILQTFHKAGIEVLSLSLGPFVTDQILQQLNFYGDELAFDEHLVTLHPDKTWADYAVKPVTSAAFQLKIDAEIIEEEMVLAYAAAFQLMLADVLEPIAVDVPELLHSRTEALAKLKFIKLGMRMLLILFGLLLINFFIFNRYNSINQESAGKNVQQVGFRENRQKLLLALAEKEKTVAMLGWNKGLPYAYICDQIGQMLPASITLTSLTSGNVEDKTGAAPSLQSRRNSVIIKGKADNVYAINDLIYACKQKEWVKDVSLEQFITDDQKQTQVFTLMLYTDVE